MARPSTNGRYPRSPCRDATEQNKAGTPDAERHGIGSGRPPSNGAPQGNQEKRGQGPERGTTRRKRQPLSSRRHRRPGPLSARTRLVPEQTEKGTCLKELSSQAHYPDRRIVTSARPAHRCAWRVYSTDRSLQRGKSPNYPLAESLDSTKASGATVRYHD